MHYQHNGSLKDAGKVQRFVEVGDLGLRLHAEASVRLGDDVVLGFVEVAEHSICETKKPRPQLDDIPGRYVLKKWLGW